MNNREMKLNEMFNAIRPRMVSLFASDFANAGADVDDAVAKAFEYIGGYQLACDGVIDAAEFGRRFFVKMRQLVLDARKLSGLARGRKSVKALLVLDAEPEEGDEYFVPTMDKVALARYAERDLEDDLEKRFLLQTKAVEQVMKENGVSDRDYEIFDRIAYRAANRQAIAREMGTSEGNVNRIMCIFRKRLEGSADAVRARYAKLAAEADLEAL